MGTLSMIGPNVATTDNVVATLEMAKAEAIKHGANKCIVILLNEEGFSYNHKYLNAGMITSGMVALLEIQKQDIIKNMG